MLRRATLAALAALLWCGAAGAACLPDSTGGGTTCTVFTTPNVVVTTQAIVTLTAATSTTLVVENTAKTRRYLCWWNIGGANPMTVVPVAPGVDPTTITVVAGQGPSYDPGSSAQNQSGAFCMESSSVSQQAFRAISTGGTSVAVWTGQ